MDARVPSPDMGAGKGPLRARRAAGTSAGAAESVAERPNLVDFPSARILYGQLFPERCLTFKVMNKAGPL